VAALLALVWWSAADLVLATDRLRLRCCANPRCGWLFLDDSKAGTRRWCSMSACGNRAKVQRHAQRQRSLKAPVRPARTR
jgi:predicted RNA-binding Zn ribbon-like protein